ncbi:D-alanyl-D-alanine carboxypeptidase [Actinacidiphila bryophytorum]|uniref:D-alanyl-D-alanine carboxypeptidase n=1 Tax=Actinacidiphila bryophytorum TaxID=1436133 RepID=UPI001960F4C2|nr:D-alanyl-D-alanine carboxypeptidase [Actinacidiphila bryophytorum]MBM9439376.1 D-alanyl-D-alanine carboxypeptidase [Actinacidiphila bryophytorum]
MSELSTREAEVEAEAETDSAPRSAPEHTPDGAPEDAPAPTPVAEEGARTAGDREGELSGTASGPAQAPASDAEGDAPEDDAVPEDVPEDAPAEAESAGDAAEDSVAEPAAEPAADPEDTGVHRAAVRKSLLRPLVSDLPAERPVGRTGRPAAGATPAWAASAPSTPPAPPAAVPLPPAAVPGEDDKDASGPEGTRVMPVPQLLPPGSGHTGSTPLKLLAHLTNTPPPRQTVLRSVVRRFKIWTPLVVLLAVVFVVVQSVRPIPAASLQQAGATSYAFAGAPLPASMPWPNEGQSVAEVEGIGSLGVHGAQTPVPIASLTKVMTAYVILRDHPLTGKQDGPLITVDQQAADESASADESTAHVIAGKKYTERQMLQLLLIPSGNNIARLLARWDAGTQEAFVAKMRSAAAGLGMTQTTYTGASGFEETTVSTAVDQLKLAREVMKNQAFRSVVSLAWVVVPDVGKIYNNNNDLVNPGVIGIKTGSSTPAGGALMWAANKKAGGKEQLILGVVLQQHGGTTVNDSLNAALARSQQLIESVQGGLTSATIVKKGQVVGEVSDGLGGSTPVVAAADLTAAGWGGLRSTLTLTPPPGGLPHSAKAGAVVGTLTVGSGDARASVPAILQSDLKSPSFTSKLTHF